MLKLHATEMYRKMTQCSTNSTNISIISRQMVGFPLRPYYLKEGTTCGTVWIADRASLPILKSERKHSALVGTQTAIIQILRIILLAK
jgi:hypothetical protein